MHGTAHRNSAVFGRSLPAFVADCVGNLSVGIHRQGAFLNFQHVARIFDGRDSRGHELAVHSSRRQRIPSSMRTAGPSIRTFLQLYENVLLSELSCVNVVSSIHDFQDRGCSPSKLPAELHCTTSLHKDRVGIACRGRLANSQQCSCPDLQRTPAPYRQRSRLIPNLICSNTD